MMVAMKMGTEQSNRRPTYLLPNDARNFERPGLRLGTV